SEKDTVNDVLRKWITTHSISLLGKVSRELRYVKKNGCRHINEYIPAIYFSGEKPGFLE
ncbi:13493_t:CDS:1, partial [Acaulospora morrowiae]